MLVEPSGEDDLLPVAPESPTPHRDKLHELLSNLKLPTQDRRSIEAALERHASWVGAMDAITLVGDDKVAALVTELNDYKRWVEVEVIWDSEADFLYRQRGQLKLDNSIIEEFLPRLVDPSIIPALNGKAYEAGPRKTFSAAYFATTLTAPMRGAGLQIRTKNQDFTVSRTAYLQASHSPSFPPGDTTMQKLSLAFVAAECKTNLDKTMYQEAVATAHDVKVAVPGARYYLLCEWLDMAPLSTIATDIDEAIILRGKRLQSSIRSRFANSAARKRERGWYTDFLAEHPIRVERVLRFVNHLRSLFEVAEPDEEDILRRGYF